MASVGYGKHRERKTKHGSNSAYGCVASPIKNQTMGNGLATRVKQHDYKL